MNNELCINDENIINDEIKLLEIKNIKDLIIYIKNKYNLENIFIVIKFNDIIYNLEDEGEM